MPTFVVRPLHMVGGRGWDNQDYLSSLSGDEDDREKVQEEYQDFSDRRAAFLERQEKILKTPRGQAFMKQQQDLQAQRMAEGVDNSGNNSKEDDGNDFVNISETSEGGTRMSQMLAQAQRMKAQQRAGRMGGMQGGARFMMEQKFAFDLDEEDDGGVDAESDNIDDQYI